MLDNSKTIDTLIKQKAQKIASDTLSVDSSSIEKTFQLSATAEMHFQGKGRLFATIKNEPSSTNQSTYDTILNVAIDDIKGFKLYNFENILVVSYNFDAPNDRILYAGQFKIPDFVEYVYTLNKKGFHMELGTSSFRVQTIIGFVVIFLGVIFQLLIFFSQDDFWSIDNDTTYGGCCITSIVIFIGLVVVFLALGAYAPGVHR